MQRHNDGLRLLTRHAHPYQLVMGCVLLFASVPLQWWVSHAAQPTVFETATFVAFHTAIELFAVVVAMLIFVTGYRAILSVRKSAVVLLGVVYLGVGLLDLLHTLSYVGMADVVTPNTPQKSIFFWLTARLLAAGGLLVYLLLPRVPDVSLLKKRLAIGVMLSVVAALGWAGLYHPNQLPALFLPGQGLSDLKIQLEWLIVTIHMLTLGVLWQRRASLAQECLMALAFAAALSAASELFFTQLGVHDQDAANALGHAYKVAAYLYLFHATFNEALRRPLERMAVQLQREDLILNAAPDGIMWIDTSGLILRVNPAMEKLSGFRADELKGRNVDIFLPEHLRERHGGHLRTYFNSPQPRAMGSLDLSLLRADGQMLPVDIALGHFQDEGQQFAIAYLRDLTERKKFEESLKHQATHDELTNLPNRWLFRLQLTQTLLRSARTGLRTAVLFLDLDDFKHVNDSLGHAAGDALLVQVSMRMRHALRENDLMARLGGDEFAILLTDLSSSDEAASVATKLLAALEAAYRVNDQDVYTGASMGLAFYPDDATDSDSLLRFADMAMYRAKEAGRGTYSLYSKDMDIRVHEDMQMHTRLKEAIVQGALQLHYQPQVNVQTGEIMGAEALLRWHDAELGQVPPARFIPVAEATGLILPLSQWVLETACQQIAAWAAHGTPLQVAVNMSAQQFRQRDLPEKVMQVLARTGAKAKYLLIEITESAAMAQPEHAREQLNALVSLGCSVALDDFGTGYSSLSYLKALPVKELKIDKSFMDGVPHDADDVAISLTIIGLAKNLGRSLVAEGVETQAQLDFLRTHGCENYQGWLFSKALPAHELTHLLTTPSQATAA
ncbi:MAG: EAL domain-containing protein [Burkholderiales bacterium]|nr:EAL domain-containing protein [Burkholderiales bacterium]